MSTPSREDFQAITALRLKLLENGYTPLPNYDKRNFLKGWPSVHVDEAAVQTWARRHKSFAATGLRLQDGLAVIDIDIDDELTRYLPDVTGKALYRCGAGHKEAWLVRTAEPFGRIHSRRWLAPGDTLDDGAHGIEIFGGACARQFGAFGAHTRLDNGETPINYEWDGDSPITVSLDRLPLLAKAQLFDFIDIAELALKEKGWTPIARSVSGENEAERVYDIGPKTIFDTSLDCTMTLEELRTRDAEDLRCSASFIELGAVNRTRCIVGQTHDGHLTIWDSATAITHMEADRAAPEPDTTAVARRLEALAETQKIKDGMTLKPRDNFETSVEKIVQLYGFCPTAAARTVVPLDTTEIDAGMSKRNFADMLSRWAVPKTNAKGEQLQSFQNPADKWLRDKRLTIVAGLRMRPDMGAPTYSEDGALWVNTYRPVDHPQDGGGDASVGVEFMTHLVPDERERQWFMSWLAYKYRKPCEPGPGVIMVAEEFGTGRGALAQLIGHLFGRRYVKSVRFEMLTGQIGQSQYNDWSADALFVVVNESSATPAGSGTFRAKSNAYEHLKDLVDPRNTEHLIVRKTEPNYMARRYASYLVMTNHRDAVPVPADDRRFAVLTNGGQREPEYWEDVEAWMSDPANVGAFARYLEAFDVGDYTPYKHALDTRAKRSMAHLNTSDIDQAITDAIADMKSELTTLDALARVAQAHLAQGDYASPGSAAVLRREARRRLYRLHRPGVADERITMPDGKRYHACAASQKGADRWSRKSHDAIVAELNFGGARRSVLAEPRTVIPFKAQNERDDDGG